MEAVQQIDSSHFIDGQALSCALGKPSDDAQQDVPSMQTQAMVAQIDVLILMSTRCLTSFTTLSVNRPPSC